MGIKSWDFSLSWIPSDASPAAVDTILIASTSHTIYSDIPAMRQDAFYSNRITLWAVTTNMSSLCPPSVGSTRDSFGDPILGGGAVIT